MESKMIIKEFNEYVDGFVECCTSDEQTHELLKAVAKLIEDQEERIAIMTEGGWHDAKTDPPKQPGYYIIFDDGSEFSARYETDLAEALGIDSDEKAWFILSEDGIQWLYPSHWTNLPEPPKEGEA